MAPYVFGTVVAGVVVLGFMLRVGRSLERIEAAVRTRKDQQAPDVLVSDMAAGFFSASA